MAVVYRPREHRLPRNLHSHLGAVDVLETPILHLGQQTAERSSLFCQSISVIPGRLARRIVLDKAAAQISLGDINYEPHITHQQRHCREQ
jgi:hypothetical protein